QPPCPSLFPYTTLFRSVVYTREPPPGYARLAGRLTVADISFPAGSPITGYVCGSSNFAEAATGVLMDAGLASERIRVERFGPSRSEEHTSELQSRFDLV